MANAIPLTSRRAGTLTAVSVAPAIPALNNEAQSIERQAAIENALSMALYFMRRPGGTAADVWAATARTNRALTLLKQAGSSLAKVGGRGER